MQVIWGRVRYRHSGMENKIYQDHVNSFSGCDGVVHHKFTPPPLQGTLCLQYYTDAVWYQGENKSGDWLVHHDSAPPHTALSHQQSLTKNKMAVVPHSITHRI
jgi:hypothetical protein